MRRVSPAWIAALLAAGCTAVVPLTPDLRDEVAGTPEAIATRDFRVLGQFELHTAGRATIVVNDRAQTLAVTSPDDTTLVVTVLGAQVSGTYDTLRLTFIESRAHGGSFTLRAINGTPLGGAIPVGIVSYQYVPCVLSLGMTCDRPISAAGREDQQVRLGIIR